MEGNPFQERFIFLDSSPSSDPPTGYVFMYVEGGVLKTRDDSGTIKTVVRDGDSPTFGRLTVDGGGESFLDLVSSNNGGGTANIFFNGFRFIFQDMAGTNIISIREGAPADSLDLQSTGIADFLNMPTVGGDDIVESGSNSDGSWVKYADGTMKQWGEITTGSDISVNNSIAGGFRSGTNALPLPQNFNNTSYNILSGRTGDDSAFGVDSFSDVVGQAGFVLKRITSGTASSGITLGWLAIGKWK